VEKKERKKATGKRYTARFPDKALMWLLCYCNVGFGNSILDVLLDCCLIGVIYFVNKKYERL
jgi:hypothetical protein